METPFPLSCHSPLHLPSLRAPRTCFLSLQLSLSWIFHKSRTIQHLSFYVCSDYVTLPRDLHHAPLLPLHDGTLAPWCPGRDPSPRAQPSSARRQPLRHTTAMVMRGNCSFYAKGWLAQDQGAHGLLIVSRVGGQQCSDSSLAPQDPHRPLPGLTIPVAVLRYADMLDILSHTRGSAAVRVALYAPPEPILDYNMVVIFVLAVGTVAEEDDEDAPVDFTPAVTGAVVAMSCAIMLLLYFFYDRFVYVMIAIFGLGAGTGLYSCLAPLVRRLPLQPWPWPVAGRRTRLQLPPLLLAGLCAVVTTLWVAHRNEDRWAWLLQDTLGVAYCLFVLRRVRLPTLRNCASFLLALLAFDVFFVFVTPLLTRTGESIMVEVASGPMDSLSHERLPMVLKVPRLSFSAWTLCDQPFSILGFGDIVVPGFLVAYCHRFDVQIRSRQVYFVACTTAYAVGLLITFVAMVLMQMGQPALLYLVSSTLLTSLAVAACRQELTLFWTGQEPLRFLDHTTSSPSPLFAHPFPSGWDALLGPDRNTLTHSQTPFQCQLTATFPQTALLEASYTAAHTQHVPVLIRLLQPQTLSMRLLCAPRCGGHGRRLPSSWGIVGS
uniref:Signal peptide peptidase-like 2C n=1 Tax=Ursus americanus TaxID=9643 RepID=A0A452RU32_URSAM